MTYIQCLKQWTDTTRVYYPQDGQTWWQNRRRSPDCCSEFTVIINLWNTSDRRILAVNVTPNQNCNITFICIYKPPNANNSLFNTNLQAVLISTRKNNSRICLLGDFNFPHIRRKNDGMGEPKSYDDTIFCETLEDFSFQQMNILPSTRHGNVLDLILTNFIEHFQIQTVYDDEFRTDHRILNFNLPVPSKPKRFCTTRCIYNYKNVNWSDMEMKINTSNLEDRVIEATNID